MEFPALPLHQVILNQLRQQIEGKVLKAGEKLPSEKELCSRFAVSRITVRKSLSELQALGLIHSVPGKGTFVSPPQVKETLLPLSSFTYEMEKRGFGVFSRVLAFEAFQADPETAAAFRVSPDTQIVRLERVRTRLPEGTPVSIQKVLLLHSRCPNILRIDMTSASLYQILQEKYGLFFSRTDMVITARMSEERENTLLGLNKSTALIQDDRTTYLDTGEIIEISHSVFRPDLFCFKISIEGRNAVQHPSQE